MPPRLIPVVAFHVFNTLSWSIVQGFPLLLFLKALDAPATVLGLAVGMTPFFQLLQVPGARWVERVGYRTAAVRGWTARNLVLIALVGVAAAAPWLPAAVTIGLTMGIMLIYNALRGAAGAAFMPWLSQLCPANIRGAYLGREKMAIQSALLFSIVSVTLSLQAWPGIGTFAGIFAASWLMGAIAVQCLRRIDDVPVAPDGAAPPTPVPWRVLWSHLPFRRQVTAMATMNLAQGGALVLWIPVLRDQFHLPDAAIATFPILSAGTNAIAMMVLGRVLDRVGSRPILAVGAGLVTVHLLLWAGLAGGWLSYGLTTIAALQVTAGLGFSGVAIANERLLIANLPVHGKSHYFACSSLVNGLILGGGPILWGGLVDLLSGWSWGPLNHHSLPYVLVALVAGGGGFLLQRIPEDHHAAPLRDLWRGPLLLGRRPRHPSS